MAFWWVNALAVVLDKQLSPSGTGASIQSRKGLWSWTSGVKIKNFWKINKNNCFSFMAAVKYNYWYIVEKVSIVRSEKNNKKCQKYEYFGWWYVPWMNEPNLILQFNTVDWSILFDSGGTQWKNEYFVMSHPALSILIQWSRFWCVTDVFVLKNCPNLIAILLFILFGN